MKSPIDVPLDFRWRPKLRSSSNTWQTIDLVALQNLAAQVANDYCFATFSLGGFYHWIESKRKRQILAQPWTLPTGVYGAWLSAGPLDFIFYDENACGVHQVHIQLHELSHMLCGHTTLDLNQAAQFEYRHLMTWLDQMIQHLGTPDHGIVSSLLARSHLGRNQQQESEAEVLTELLINLIHQQQLQDDFVRLPRHSTDPVIQEAYHILRWI